MKKIICHEDSIFLNERVELEFGFWPPSVNAYWMPVVMKTRGSNRSYVQMVLTPKAKDFRKLIVSRINELRYTQNLRHTPFSGPIEVFMVFYPPDRRKHDLDNLCKGVWDAMTHAGIWEDDSQVVRSHSAFGHIVKNGGFSITILPCEELL